MKETVVIQESEEFLEMEMLSTTLSKLAFDIIYLPQDSLAYEACLLRESSLVAGDISFVEGAMELLGIPIPAPKDYPDCLQAFLKRKIWHSTFGALEKELESNGSQPVFAKPSKRRKLFKGSQFQYPSDFVELEHIPRDTPILCSEIVPIISEFRVYVMNSKILAVENYDGDPSDSIDLDVVKTTISTLDAHQQSLAAYAIDFGLLSTGETILVEMNDGYSIGTFYGIEAEDYTKFTLCRWQELSKQ